MYFDSFIKCLIAHSQYASQVPIWFGPEIIWALCNNNAQSLRRIPEAVLVNKQRQQRNEQLKKSWKRKNNKATTTIKHQLNNNSKSINEKLVIKHQLDNRN